MTETAAWPTEVRLKKDRRTLAVSFDSSEHYELPAEFSRISSPSAEVQGHSAAERKLQYGKRDVEIVALEPVGNYAVRITFSDLHASGIYMWDYLLELGRNQARLWADYLAELEAAGRPR